MRVMRRWEGKKESEVRAWLFDLIVADEERRRVAATESQRERSPAVPS